jgi:two-component system LytT family response regulator
MKAEFTCIIIDEDIEFSKSFSDKLAALYGNIDIAGVVTNWQDALPLLRHGGIDVVFLESLIQQKTGIDLLRMVPGLKAEAIFVTANPAYAIEAFRALAVGYLLKPVDDSALVKTIDRSFEIIRNRRTAELNIPASKPASGTRIGIPNNRGIEYIDLDSIIYFEATSRYTTVVAKDRELLSSYNIGKFKLLVEEHRFFQVHRSFIVNLNCIRRYDANGSITLSNGKEIPVSKGLREEFLKVFEKVGKNLT